MATPPTPGAVLPDTPEALTAAGWRLRTLAGYASRFGPLWTRQEEAGWAYGVLPTAEHLNPAGAVHGGVFASLMDHVLSAVAWEALGRQPCVTVQLDTQFLQAAREGQFLEGRGQVVRIAGSLVFMHGTVSHAGDALMTSSATGRTKRALGVVLRAARKAMGTAISSPG